MILSRLAFLFITLVGTSLSYSQSTFSGFARSYAGYTPTSPPNGIVKRNSLRLESDIRFSHFRAYTSVQADHEFNSSPHSFGLFVRETYLDARTGPFDIRAGRFMHHFGRSEGLVLTNVFSSYDLSEFLTQDITDLTRGLDGIRVSGFLGSNAVHLLASPFQPESSLPTGIWSVTNESINGIPIQATQRKNQALETGPLRMAGIIALRPRLNIDVDLAVAHWSLPVDAYEKSIRPFPLQIDIRNKTSYSWMAMMSSEIRATSILAFTTELVYWNAKPVDILPPPPSLTFLFSETQGFLRNAPYVGALAGVKTVWWNVNVSQQLFMEHIIQPPAHMLADQTVFGTTLTFWRRFFYDDLTVRMMTRYQFDPSGYWMNPEGMYRINDSIHLRLGAHLFGGSKPDDENPTFSFGQYRSNQFLYGKFAFFF